MCAEMRRRLFHGTCRSLAPVAVLAAFAPFARAGAPFITATVPPGQSVRQLLAGTFIEKVRCVEACVATTNLVISPALAKQLHFPSVKPKQPYAIALIQTNLKAGAWTTIRLRAGSQARPLLAKSASTIRVDGVIYGRSSTNASHKGAGGWSVMLRR